jgi:hypothetical protein
MRSSPSCAKPGRDRHGHRLSALIVVLWRAGLRINEALSLAETDRDQRRGSILVRHGQNDRRRDAGMDAWAWTAIEPWLTERVTLPVGPLFGVIGGPTRGRGWSAERCTRRAAPSRAPGRSQAPVRAPPLCRPPGYADRAGEVPQVAYVAVGRVGIIHGDSQARLMSGARSTMAGTGDRF